MGHHVTLDLPPEWAEDAPAVALHSHRRVEDVLLEWLEHAATDVPVDLIPDEQVLALRDQQMSEDQCHINRVSPDSALRGTINGDSDVRRE